MSIAEGDPAARVAAARRRRRRGAAVRASPGRSRRLAWRHPEWWALGLAVAAWALLIAADLGTAGGTAHAAHAAHHGHGAAAGATALLAETVHWQLMVVAMMLPVIVPSLRFTAFRSLWRRRHRAVAEFLVGYLAVWALLGLAVGALLALAPALTGPWRAEAAAGAFLLAAVWQWTPVKRRALVACHRTAPLAPSGVRASRDCLRFGWTIGCWCCVSCALLMVACTLTGHSTLALAACGGIGLAERYTWRPDPKLLAAAMLALALVFGPLGAG